MTDQILKTIKTPRAVLFDLDGTLVDTAGDFIEVLNRQRVLHQLPPLPEKTIRDEVSNGARALTSLAFGGEPGEPVFEARRQELLDLYLDEVGNSAWLFPGMDELLKHLEQQNIHWGVVTNKPRLYTERLLERLLLSKRCAVTVCPDDIDQRKPHPEGLFKANNALGLQSEHTWYVGDHLRDIEAGQRAGMLTVAACYGYVEDPEICHSWGASWCIDHPSELLNLLNNLTP